MCSLNSCLEQWGVAEDVYCLGPTSRIIGAELASLPWAKGRRKVNLNVFNINAFYVYEELQNQSIEYEITKLFEMFLGIWIGQMMIKFGIACIVT